MAILLSHEICEIDNWKFYSKTIWDLKGLKYFGQSRWRAQPSIIILLRLLIQFILDVGLTSSLQIIKIQYLRLAMEGKLYLIKVKMRTLISSKNLNYSINLLIGIEIIWNGYETSVTLPAFVILWGSSHSLVWVNSPH